MIHTTTRFLDWSIIPIPTMIPTLQSDMYVDAFHGDQESTLQTVPFKEFTLRAESLLLVLWTITFQVHQFFARCSHWVLMRLQPSLSVWKATYRGSERKTDGPDMYVDAFHGDQESTLQTVPFKEFTLRAEPLLLVLWTIKSRPFKPFHSRSLRCGQNLC